jgi:hypothetical protein
VAREIIENCDAPGCTSVRSWRENSDGRMPHGSGWLACTFVRPPRGEDPNPRRVFKNACSTKCALSLVGAMLADGLHSDAVVEFCPGHGEGECPH